MLDLRAKRFPTKTTFSKKTREKGRFGSLTPWNVVPNNVSHNTFSISMCLSFTCFIKGAICYIFSSRKTHLLHERTSYCNTNTHFVLKTFPMGVSKFVKPLYSIGPNKRRHWHTVVRFNIYFLHNWIFSAHFSKKSFILQIGNTENNTYFLPCVQAKFLACWLSAIFWVFNGKRPTQMLNMTIVYTLFLTIYFAYLFSINTWISAAIKFTWLCNNVVGGTGFLAIHLVCDPCFILPTCCPLP